MVAVKTDKIHGDALGTGRRKSSVARVRVRVGSGRSVVNERPFEEFFLIDQDHRSVMDVLASVQRTDSVDVIIRLNAGGTTGQAGSCRMGIAQDLCSYDMELFPTLCDAGYLTRY